MRRRVYLHGSLKDIHEGPIEVVADTVADAIKHISLLLPGFQPNAKTGYRRIQVLGCNKIEDFFKVDDGREEIHIFPQLNGGKRGGFFQILIGVALAAVGFFLGGMVGGLLLNAGIMLVLGGLMQLLQQPKRDNKEKEQNKSQYLGSPRNTVEIGTRIPILYGRRRVGGHYLSFNISAVDGVI